MNLIVTVIELMGGVPGGETQRFADSSFASVFQLGFSSQQQVRYPCIALLSCIVLQNDAAREVLSHRCDRARVRAGAARADASEVTWRI